MQAFEWREGVLEVDGVPLPAIAMAAGTPTYVYAAGSIRAAHARLQAAFAPLRPELHYAVKANPNLEICRLLAELGTGMDVVSGGEMERAWLAGVAMEDMVFAGVGKSDAEIRAALDGRWSPLEPVEAAAFGRPAPAGRGSIGLFNIESPSELAAIARLAEEAGVPAAGCVRINPDVDPGTHEYTTTGKQENKFGVDADLVVELFDGWRDHPWVRLRGLHVHIGSPVPRPEPFVAAVEVALGLLDRLAARGHTVDVLDLGGGWPVAYREDEGGDPVPYAEALIPLLAPRVERGLRLVLEPGRSLVAAAGLLLTRVQHVKHGRARRFVICDAGMQTLLRPSLYRAFHFVWPVHWDGERPAFVETPALPGLAPADVVGPICETGDFLARGRSLPEIAAGDLLAVFTAGAYGMSMASNYNDHPRPAEVLVEEGRARLVQRRQRLAELFEPGRDVRELDLTAPAAGGAGVWR